MDRWADGSVYKMSRGTNKITGVDVCIRTSFRTFIKKKERRGEVGGGVVSSLRFWFAWFESAANSLANPCLRCVCRTLQRPLEGRLFRRHWRRRRHRERIVATSSRAMLTWRAGIGQRIGGACEKSFAPGERRERSASHLRKARKRKRVRRWKREVDCMGYLGRMGRMGCVGYVGYTCCVGCLGSIGYIRYMG